MFQRIRTLWRNLVVGGEPRPEGGTGVEDDERRVWVRHPADFQTTLQPVGNGVLTQLSARVRNVSRGGINLIVSLYFEPGDMVSIELPGATRERQSAVLACVVHVTEVGPQEWRLGCTFAEELADDDLATFGAKRQRADSDDKRNWVRFESNVRVTYQEVDVPDQTTWEAQVENISASGIALVVNRTVEMGALLNLHLRNAGSEATRTILACVVHVTTRPGQELGLGCTFLRELSESDLKAIL